MVKSNLDGCQTLEFSDVYKSDCKKIYNYILYNTGNVEDALDLTSDTFFKALRAWPRYKQRNGSPTAWLFKIASRELAMYYRKKQKSVSLEYSQEGIEIREELGSQLLSAAQIEIDNRDDFMSLSASIRKLPLKYREVVFFRFYMGMSIDEIASTLKRPAGTIKVQISRALKILHDDM